MNSFLRLHIFLRYGHGLRRGCFLVFFAGASPACLCSPSPAFGLGQRHLRSRSSESVLSGSVTSSMPQQLPGRTRRPAGRLAGQARARSGPLPWLRRASPSVFVERLSRQATEAGPCFGLCAGRLGLQPDARYGAEADPRLRESNYWVPPGPASATSSTTPQRSGVRAFCWSRVLLFVALSRPVFLPQLLQLLHAALPLRWPLSSSGLRDWPHGG